MFRELDNPIAAPCDLNHDLEVMNQWVKIRKYHSAQIQVSKLLSSGFKTKMCKYYTLKSFLMTHQMGHNK